MRQRLHIARGLLHDPAVLFLDEPTIGIDPVGARELRTMIAGLKAAGKTVLLTTHYMFEADELCDRIAVDRARARSSRRARRATSSSSSSEGVVVEIEVYGIEDAASSSSAGSTASRRSGSRTRDQAQVVVVQAGAGREPTQEILARLDGVSVGRITTREPTLEDAYVALVTQPERPPPV